MIVNCFLTDKCAETAINAVSADETVNLEERIRDKDFSSIFSAQPYKMLIDYDKIFSMKAAEQFAETEFQGSKILYCIFISTHYKNGYMKFAEKVAKYKKMVLFGSDIIYADESGKIVGAEAERLNLAATYMRDSRPLTDSGALAFPNRLKCVEKTEEGI